MLSDKQLLQFSRQIMLTQIDIQGQQKLLEAKVLIVGIGGLGSPVSLYLAAAGVGHLVLVDDDQVELSNLQRQIVHTLSQVGNQKVDSAKSHLHKISPECHIQTVGERLNEVEIRPLIETVDIVVDCTDNFETRFLLNRECYRQQKTLVSAAAIRWEGQLSTFTMQKGTPCYRCLYDEGMQTDQTCVSNGVVAPLVGVLGSMQALEVIKSIVGAGQLAVGRLLLFDALAAEWRQMSFTADPDCPVCN